MLVENDIIQVVVNQRHANTGQTILNVFHYRADEVVGDWSDPENFEDIAAEVYLGMSTNVSGYQSVELVYDTASFTNLTNGLDIALYVPVAPAQGQVASASEPLQVALSFRLNRATRATRNGSKRFGGIADTIIVDPQGASLSGAALTVVIQDWLATPIEVVAEAGVTCLLTPIILRRTAAGVPPTVYSEVATAIYRGAGSQNSRKELL